MTNYTKKHKFEFSGLFNDLGKPECKCGLPEDIPSMHFSDVSKESEKVEGGGKEKCLHPRVMLITTQKGNIRCAWCKKLWLSQQLLDSALREQGEKIFSDFEFTMKTQNRVAGLPGETCTTFDVFGFEKFDELRAKYLPKKGEEHHIAEKSKEDGKP